MYSDIEETQLPIIYRPEYNVHFMGMQKLHPFDAGKWGHIFKYLKKAGLISEETVTKPNEATTDDLLVVHSKRYIRSLKYSFNVARIAEIPLLMFVPNCLVQSGYLKPMRYQTGGSILAGKLALERGWAINIGGGFHHCSADRGSGFCPYADITLLIKFLFNNKPQEVKKAMIIDLDAHQGNGYERDFLNDKNVYILDVYNQDIYPHDEKALPAISCCVKLHCFTEDNEYLTKIKIHLNKSLTEFIPDVVVYNAGTDILSGDRLGLLSISAEGIIERDEIIFQRVRELHIPIIMLTSGGYLKKTAKIIANSILNLHNIGLITTPLLKV